MDIQASIKKLITYALEHHLISEDEKIYSTNLLLDVLNLDEYIEPDASFSDVDLESTLAEILDYAAENHLIAENTVVYRDLFDTKVMNCVTPRPDTVIRTFRELYEKSPKEATDWYYQFSKDSDYVRSYRIRKDLKWTTPTPYGDLDITINLSKPEKDPKAIAAAKNLKQSSYPKCQLCKENEGYRGRVNHPARETIRIIPIRLAGDDFFLQYSPYSYYNEHCIVFNKNHIPMIIDEKALRHLLSFVEMFPHYILGSNADLPIVGGSILTHDHYQGGNYVFPMFRAQDCCALSFQGFEDVKASYLRWPLSDIRIESKDPDELLKLAVKILSVWRNYTDPASFIYANTDGTPHNTISPIAHRKGENFVLDLALRNNITTEKYPLGVYHPHPEYWNIKKENIGLIEVMGLAILPSRLKAELAAVKAHLLAHEDLKADPLTEKHADWVAGFIGSYPDFSAENADAVLEKEVGVAFQHVLECAGVYKQTEEGKAGLLRFVDRVNQN
jgi:UDPglucose--hexose-1-phosphate uridylyltransferase